VSRAARPGPPGRGRGHGSWQGWADPAPGTVTTSSLGYEVATFLRTPEELAAVAAHRPFTPVETGAAGHSLYVAFLRDAPNKEAGEKLLSFRTPVDEFELVGRELYWLCRGRMTDSQVNWQQVARAVPMASTVRNVATVRKLAALVPPA
jgi:uncharacterized protein (DUF1697 family)